jgi:hypothetical protein
MKIILTTIVISDEHGVRVSGRRRSKERRDFHGTSRREWQYPGPRRGGYGNGDEQYRAAASRGRDV